MRKLTCWIQNHKIEAGLALCLILQLACSAGNILFRGPEYDELWTLEHYVHLPVHRIVTDVATPNNHVWNSLGIKLVHALIGFSLPAARIPALLGFCALAAFVWRLAFRMIRFPAVRGLFLTMVFFNGALLHYAETARGYSWQCAAVAGMVLALTAYENAPENSRARNRSALLWLICAVIASLAVSSGVLYSACLTLTWGLFQKPFSGHGTMFFRRFRPLILAGLGYTFFAALWYGTLFREFVKGQEAFGDVVTTADGLRLFVRNALGSTRLGLLLAAALAGALVFRNTRGGRTAFWLASALLLMLFSALATKGGPSRVYLAWIAPLAFACGTVLDEAWERCARLRRWELPIVLTAVTFAALFFHRAKESFSEPDFVRIYPVLTQMPDSTLIAWRPTDAYVIRHIFQDDALRDHRKRMLDFRKIMLVHDHLLGMMRLDDYRTVYLAPPFPCEKSGGADAPLPYWIYPVRPLRPGEDLQGKIVLCRVVGYPPEYRDPDGFLRRNFACVNTFLTAPAPEPGTPPMRLLGSAAPGMSADAMLELEHRSGGLLRFWAIAPGSMLPAQK